MHHFVKPTPSPAERANGANVQDIICGVIFSILAVLCISTNSLVCYVIKTRKTTDGAQKVYVVSLAVTDILIGAVNIPLYIAMEHSLHMVSYYQLLESLSTGLDLFLGTCSILHLCLMALDRTVSVAKPIFHRTKMRQRKLALRLLTIPWIVAPSIALLPFTGGSKKFEHTTAIMVTAFIPVPILFILVCYVIIICKIRKRNERLKRNSSTVYRVDEAKMIRTLLCMVVVFILCWVPLLVYYMLPAKVFASYASTEVSLFLYLVKFLSYFNSMCNPFIYAIFNPVFKRGFKDVFKHCSSKREGVNPTEQSSQRTERIATISQIKAADSERGEEQHSSF